MRLDIRLPIGAMFAVLGALLILYGAVTFREADMYERSLGVNINFWWGLIMLAGGGATFWLGRRGTSAMHPSDESIEGHKIEEREHRTGLEHEGRPRGH
jgi:hypothetical protein